jgi:phytoene/squalene synthetase
MKISSAAARRALARRRSPRRHGARTIDGTPRLGQRGVPILSRDARLVIGLSATLYQGILQRIRRNQYDAFGARAHVSLPAKLGALPRVWLRTRLARAYWVTRIGWISRQLHPALAFR